MGANGKDAWGEKGADGRGFVAAREEVLWVGFLLSWTLVWKPLKFSGLNEERMNGNSEGKVTLDGNLAKGGRNEVSVVRFDF